MDLTTFFSIGGLPALKKRGQAFIPEPSHAWLPIRACQCKLSANFRRHQRDWDHAALGAVQADVLADAWSEGLKELSRTFLRTTCTDSSEATFPIIQGLWKLPIPCSELACLKHWREHLVQAQSPSDLLSLGNTTPKSPSYAAKSQLSPHCNSTDSSARSSWRPPYSECWGSVLLSYRCPQQQDPSHIPDLLPPCLATVSGTSWFLLGLQEPLKDEFTPSCFRVYWESQEAAQSDCGLRIRVQHSHLPATEGIWASYLISLGSVLKLRW